MPYAVTCRSCGARFSVADDLVHKKLSGRAFALRCKRCHQPIRVGASEPPGRRSSHPPAPAARSPLPQGPARPKPRPPLKKRATPSSTAIGHHRRKPPPRSAARRPLDEQEKAGVNHDLFDAGPPSSRRYVDVSDMAHSEPPGPDSASSSSNSSTPPLFDLAHAEHPDLSRPAEDVDFLLGLTGSPGTAAVLASPSLADLARKAPSEPPPSVPKTAAKGSAAAPRAAATPRSASPVAEPAPSKKKRGGLGILLGLAAAVAAALAFGLTAQRPGSSSAESPSAAEPKPSEPEPKSLPNEPAPRELAPAPEPPANVAPPPPAEPAAASASSDAVHAPRSAKASANANTGANAASNAVRTVPPAAPAAVAKTPILPKPEPAAAGTLFDRTAAASALASAAAQASACRKEGDPSGVANVTVTFAPSGRVTTAKLSGPPFAGTATGGCIAATLRRAKIPAFDGDMVTVGKTIVVQ